MAKGLRGRKVEQRLREEADREGRPGRPPEGPAPLAQDDPGLRSAIFRPVDLVPDWVRLELYGERVYEDVEKLIKRR